VLFHAAAGGVGLIACQWAKALGLRLIGTAGSATPMCAARAGPWVRSMPSTTAEEDFLARVKEITGGKGVKVVYDSVGQGHLGQVARLPGALRPDGQLRQCVRPGAAIRAGHPGHQGLDLCDAARRCSRISRHARSTQAMADDLFDGGRAAARCRSASTSGTRWTRCAAGAPRSGGAQDHRLHDPDTVGRRRRRMAVRAARRAPTDAAGSAPVRPAESRIGYAIEQMCELIRFRSLIRSRCSELVSMLCTVLACQPPQVRVRVLPLQVAEARPSPRAASARRARGRRRNTLMPEAQVADQPLVQVADLGHAGLGEGSAPRR
jgi:hypothetical protein